MKNKLLIEVQLNHRGWYCWKIIDTDGKVYCSGHNKNLSEAYLLAREMYAASLEALEGGNG